MTNFALALHADWHCARSGACCSAGWAIPIEHAPAARVHAAALDGRLDLGRSLAGADTTVTHLWPALPDQPAEFAGVLRRDAQGRCLLLEPSVTPACALHRQLGPEALPSACRTFPRLVRQDHTGTFLSLSHHCPSVAARLFAGPLEEGPSDPLLALVAEAPLTRDAAQHEGLDARQALPPLLRPDALLDPSSQALWERHVLGVLARAVCAEQALDLLVAQAERARAWQARAGALYDWLTAALARERDQDDDVAHALRRVHGWSAAAGLPAAMLALLRAAIPEPLREQAPDPHRDLAGVDATLVQPHWGRYARAVRRYLAGRACAGWSLHQTRGLRSHVLDLGLALGLLRHQAASVCARVGRALDRALLLEAVRAADLLLLHWASREVLAEALASCEA